MMAAYPTRLIGVALVASSCVAPSKKAPAPAAVPSSAPTAMRTAPARMATLVLTTAEVPFARSTLSPSTAKAGPATVSVDDTALAQRIESFGGAFNEKGWDALSVLDETDRREVLRSLFEPASGLGFDYCRTPIGASDYAMSRYTLDEAHGDYEMKRFSIERDKEKLIPYIKAALAIRPDLELWASAWTPPTWMKQNGAFDGGAMRDDPKVYAAYALYLLKFVEAYRAEGIDVTMVVPQNEPGQLTHYPSADWQPAQYVTFIRDHLGPLLAKRSPATRVFVGTINRGDWDVAAVLSDPGVKKVVSGVALQWGGLDLLPAVRAKFPELFVMQSETECGNNHWQPGFDPDRPPNDFGYAAHTWHKLHDFLAGGASSYMLWNMVLDTHGKSIDAVRPWPQNAAVAIDRDARRAIYTPMYWVTKHFSALVRRGARLAKTSGSFADSLAFANPDGSVVVELMNETESPVGVTVVARGQSHALGLPARSFASLVVPPG